MTTKPDDWHESEMLAKVRQWRKRAYEERRRMTLEEQRRQDEELMREFGLKRPQPDQRKSDAA